MDFVTVWVSHVNGAEEVQTHATRDAGGAFSVQTSGEYHRERTDAAIASGLTWAMKTIWEHVAPGG